jgi:hypothetical protein
MGESCKLRRSLDGRIESSSPQYPVAGEEPHHSKLCDFLLVTPVSVLY